MRVLITGITGRIGANLAARLLQEGHQVRGLVWPRDPRVEKLRHLELDLREGTVVDPAVTGAIVEDIDVVYHLAAAFQGGGPFTAEEYFDINVRGLFNMLEAAKVHDGIAQFVFASTDAVLDKYVPGGPEVLREDEQPREPADWYSLSKAMGEEMCGGYFRMGAVPVTILRFPMVFGIGEVLDFPTFYLSKARGSYGLDADWDGEERLVVLRDADGRSYRKHAADVRDIVSGLAAALEKTGAAGATIQLGGPGPFTWEEAVPHLSTCLDIPYIDARVIEGPPCCYEHDLTKAHTLLDWRPRYDIIRMIDDALAFRRGDDVGVLPV